MAKGASPFANPCSALQARYARYGIFKGYCPLNGAFKGRPPLGISALTRERRSRTHGKGSISLCKPVFRVAGAVRRTSAQVVLRSECDEPERQPSGAYALQSLCHAKQGFVLKAQKPKKIEGKQGVYSRAKSECDEQSSADNATHFHTLTMRLTNVFHARATHTSRDFQGTWSLERGYKGRRPLGIKYSYRGNAVPAPLAKGESPFAIPCSAPRVRFDAFLRAWYRRKINPARIYNPHEDRNFKDNKKFNRICFPRRGGRNPHCPRSRGGEI